MANVDAPMGFSLVQQGGHEPIRRKRQILAGGGTDIAAGDAVTILANGSIERCDNSTTPNGVVEGIVLKGVNEGPISYQYAPAGTANEAIVIEDPTAMFAVQTTAQFDLADFDSGAEVNVVDAAPDTVLGQSRQQVGDVGGSQFLLVGVVDTPNNDSTAVKAKVIVQLIPANVQ